MQFTLHLLVTSIALAVIATSNLIVRMLEPTLCINRSHSFVRFIIKTILSSVLLSLIFCIIVVWLLYENHVMFTAENLPRL